MRYFSPERDRWTREAIRSGSGKLFNPEGKHIGVLPTLYIEPRDEGKWDIKVHLPTRDNAFGGFATQVEGTEGLARFAERWLADPEKVLTEEFGYKFEVKRGKPTPGERARAKASFSLSDLGL